MSQERKEQIEAILDCHTDGFNITDWYGLVHCLTIAINETINAKLTELKTNLEVARIAHNCATGIDKKNIGISIASIEYAISVLKELVE